MQHWREEEDEGRWLLSTTEKALEKERTDARAVPADSHYRAIKTIDQINEISD
jgi:hypothetical protein